MKTVIAFLFIVTLAVAQEQSEILRAIVMLTPHQPQRNVTGWVRFTQERRNGPVKIIGQINGLNSNSKHGFHVHDKGDIFSNGCLSTLGHFNPEQVPHAGPNDPIRHIGDLGNVEADSNGVANIDMTDNQISLSGPDSIIGRGMVVHAGEDDLGRTDHPDSKTTGNAGARWACGVIGIM